MKMEMKWPSLIYEFLRTVVKENEHPSQYVPSSSHQDIMFENSPLRYRTSLCKPLLPGASLDKSLVHWDTF